jgi:hypothetical protein
LSNDHASVPPSSNRERRRFRRSPYLAALGVAVTAAVGVIASSGAAKPAGSAGFKLTKLASMPAGVTNCNDVATIGTADYTQAKVPLGKLFVGCSNGVLSNGRGGPPNRKADTSTLVEFTTAGKYVKQWSVDNQIAGMGAEPLHRRILMPLDSSSNTELVFLDPNIPGSYSEIQYAYSPNPQSASAAKSLYTGGGTQSVVVDSNDDIFVTASHPKRLAATASFKVVLSAPSGPSGKGAATLSPTFSDDATAANGNTGKGKVKLALREIDANAIVPKSSRRYGGDYVVDDEATHQLVFSSKVTSGKGLTVLTTALGLRDIRWATSKGGTFYLVRRGTQKPLAKSSLYKVTGPFVTGDAYATTSNGELVRVNLSNGKLTPIVSGIGTGVGLLYVNSDKTTTQLPVNGA